MTPDRPPDRSPGLSRRLAAISYDSLLLFSIWFVAAIPLAFIPEPMRMVLLTRVLIQFYLVGISFLFFGWFWVHGGQTLGMRAWRLRVVQRGGEPITWKQALRRFLAAVLSWLCIGLGFVWILIDKDRRAWHDRLSETRLVVLLKHRTKD